MAQSSESLRLSAAPIMTTGMLIRRPVAEVFEAFIDPAITSRFWFTHGSGRLAAGERVSWTWAMYGASGEVDVRAIEPNRRILIEWQGQRGPTTVEWLFTARPDGTTFVQITNEGFAGNGDEVCAEACDAMQGFTLVLAGLKALLEHGVRLNLTADRYPDAHVEGWEAE